MFTVHSFGRELCIPKSQPTKRAPDAGDSAAISSSFLRLIIFLAGRLRRPCPSAGNANRWVALQPHNEEKVCLTHREIYGQSGY